MRPAIAPAVVLALILLVAGCGEDTSSASTTTGAPVTTAAPAATTTTATTITTAATTTAAGPAFVVGTPGFFPPEPLPGSGGANGSGCPPEDGPLPDGVWFGKLLEVSATTARLDPGCFYWDEAAQAAAAEDGITDLPSPHYLRNPLPDLVEVPVGPGAPAYSIDNTVDPLGFLTFSLEEWPEQNGGYTICPGEGCAVWLYVNDGWVTEILEQYLP